MTTIFKELADRLWGAADKLRANTHLKASEYLVPVLGLIFLKFADQKFTVIDRMLRERMHKSEGGLEMLRPDRYHAEGAIYLDSGARFANLRKLSTNIDEKLNNAMRLVERDNKASLEGALPTNGYSTLDNETLRGLLTTFDNIPLDIEGNLFSKIYEYFLDKFALAEGQRGGEFFTPTSIVKLIVEVIEPYSGLIFDPACGSGRMFVQSAQFVQRHKLNPNERVSIYGQEKSLETVQRCKMNLAINGLSGDVKSANSYYEDPFSSTGKFDFVMANPPFNVDGVEKSRLLNVDKTRFPFDAPRVDNANYLWIQLFYSTLKEQGRAGFVMPNSASDARSQEREIRSKIIKTGAVDVMVSVGSNFFYTVTLPCTLWFFDKGKRNTGRGDRVLFIDARHLYKQIDRAHREFTPEQIEFLANIVHLYRGEALETEQGSTVLMQEHFPDVRYTNIAGLCKVATITDIEAQGWSLNPRLYVETISKDFHKRTIIFISYSHKDKKYLDRLRVHLSPIVQSNNVEIEIWDDTKISPGERWREKIKKAIERTKIAILLVSADFLASQFIATDELPPLLEAADKEGAIILPVMLSPCMFTDTELGTFQLVNSKVMTRMNKNDQEETWVKVASRVKSVMTLLN